VIISIYYYFKVLVSMYMHPPLRERHILPADLAVHFAGAIIFLLLFWLGVFPSPLLSVIDQVSALFLR
jgi:NADH:ubiquinone oxidoreductase subunit 2 (subunit N)